MITSEARTLTAVESQSKSNGPTFSTDLNIPKARVEMIIEPDECFSNVEINHRGMSPVARQQFRLTPKPNSAMVT